MSWKKHFRTIPNNVSPISGSNKSRPGFKNYQSSLPEVYVGHPNRLERYNQYEQMDMDSEVSASLDVIAEFSTQTNIENGTIFKLNFIKDPTDNEIKIIKEQLENWGQMNKFKQRAFRLFRNTIKYGDQIFIRDPETFKLHWVDMNEVIKIIVNESEGKTPEQYIIRNIAPNLETLSATQKPISDLYISQSTAGAASSYQSPAAGGVQSGGRFTVQQNEITIDAEHIVHLSLTEGLDITWPFGTSSLEKIFKVYKQKELLEDAILIYRIQRAPERRIFYIDVGNMPSHLAMQFVERVKNEIHQRRIPTQSGGGASMMDATYNPLCLDLETRIPLLDGRTLSLNELISEFENGKQNWAYSCDPDSGQIVPGVIEWAGVTRKNAETIKLTFDNGETLICTPDHKIPVFGKGFVEAKDIVETDSLISFNTKNKSIAGGKTNEYQQVWDHESKSWIFTHRMVGQYFKNQNKHQEFTFLPENLNEDKNTIHHNDYNRFNNDPRNLQFMNKEDHILFHSSQKANFWNNMSDTELDKIKSKISESAKLNWKNKSPIERASALYNIRSAQKKSVWMRQNDPVTKESYRKIMSKSRREHLAANPLSLAQNRKNCESRIKIKNQELTVTFDMLQHIAEKVKSGITNKKALINECDKDERLLQLVKDANSEPLDYKNAQCKIDFTKFGYSKLNKLLTKFKYKNWKTFVKEVNNFNHRVVKIEKVSNRDVGTITIDGNERWHDFHTFAIESGIFVKNSMNEDYFFPQTADGRGSKVETLPGGDNLGEIDDLKYFNNKMARGMGIPTSYLPSGPDEGTASYNDGRVGTALIQEWRFNQNCMRLQNKIVDTLDREFKMFLNWRGINIDNSIFELEFNEPQNFAAYSQADVDSVRIGVFSQMAELPFMSKRFAMKRYLGMTEEEMADNTRLWEEENGEGDNKNSGESDLRSAGVTPGGIESDMDTFDDLEAGIDDEGGDDMDASESDAGINNGPEQTPEI